MKHGIRKMCWDSRIWTTVLFRTSYFLKTVSLLPHGQEVLEQGGQHEVGDGHPQDRQEHDRVVQRPSAVERRHDAQRDPEPRPPEDGRQAQHPGHGSVAGEDVEVSDFSVETNMNWKYVFMSTQVRDVLNKFSKWVIHTHQSDMLLQKVIPQKLLSYLL